MLSSEVTETGVHLITLERPKVNALCVELLETLASTAAEIARDSPRAVVLTGGPRVFAAGADITEFTRDGGSGPFALAGEAEVSRIAMGGSPGMMSSTEVTSVPVLSPMASPGSRYTATFQRSRKPFTRRIKRSTS